MRITQWLDVPREALSRYVKIQTDTARGWPRTLSLRACRARPPCILGNPIRHRCTSGRHRPGKLPIRQKLQRVFLIRLLARPEIPVLCVKPEEDSP